MLSKTRFNDKTVQEKKDILHTMLEPIKDSSAVYQKAWKILHKPHVKENSLNNLYSHLHDAIVRYKERKHLEDVHDEHDKLEHMHDVIVAIHEREMREDPKDSLEEELMWKLEKVFC